jgi:hypothetical protein
VVQRRASRPGRGRARRRGRPGPAERQSWAAVLARVCALDVCQSPLCGGRRRIVGVPTGSERLRVMSARLGLVRASPSAAPARSPPRRGDCPPPPLAIGLPRPAGSGLFAVGLPAPVVAAPAVAGVRLDARAGLGAELRSLSPAGGHGLAGRLTLAAPGGDRDARAGVKGKRLAGERTGAGGRSGRKGGTRDLEHSVMASRGEAEASRRPDSSPIQVVTMNPNPRDDLPCYGSRSPTPRKE